MADRDWIDEIAAERARGYNRPLHQSQHAAVNARYPGLTIKRCPYCGTAIDDCEAECDDCYEEAQHDA